MTEPEVFILAEQALQKSIDQIKDDQWDMKAPPEMVRGRDMTLHEVINYHAYDDIWVPDVLAGKTIEEVGKKYDGDLLGEDPKASYAKITEAAQAAARNFTDLDKTVHLSYGDYPAGEYFRHITGWRTFRAWQIARLIGADDTLPDALVEGVWEQLKPEIEQWRAIGVYGPEVKVGEDADKQTKLLGLAGFKA